MVLDHENIARVHLIVLLLLAGTDWAICAGLLARGVLTFIASRFCILLLSKGVVLRGAWARRCTSITRFGDLEATGGVARSLHYVLTWPLCAPTD
jgi:hypothetical protein